MTFESKDWVLRKEQFSNLLKGKLDAKGDSPFKILEKIYDNAYKIDLPIEYNVSCTFNVSDLSSFDVDANSRTNPFKGRVDDITRGAQEMVETMKGPITKEIMTRR